jgi:hypothetical protein
MLGVLAGANVCQGPIFGQQVQPDMHVRDVATWLCEHGLGKRRECLNDCACDHADARFSVLGPNSGQLWTQIHHRPIRC